MKVAFDGIGYIGATFAANGGQAGQVCKLADNATVAPCADGDGFIGLMEQIRGGHAGVQLHGFAEVSYTGSAPGLGYTALVADGKGGVKTASNGRTCLVVAVDKTALKAIVEL